MDVGKYLPGCLLSLTVTSMHVFKSHEGSLQTFVSYEIEFAAVYEHLWL